MFAPSLRSSLAALGVLSGLAVGFVACVDAPRLSAGDAPPATPTNLPATTGTDPAHPGMAFVAGIAVDIPSTSPASKGQGDEDEDDDDEGKGKGPGKKDAGPPPPPPPPPAPSGPTATHLEVAGFWIDVHEVTIESFRACVAAGGCGAPAAGADCTMESGLVGHPVSCVTLDQARGYCAWQRKRLVTNDEWTAAATGAALRPYPWGAEPPAAERLNACGPECAAAGMYGAPDPYARTAPTGAFPSGRTPDGVDDLAGNVAEWVEGLVPTARGGSFEDVDIATVRSLASRVVEAPSPAVGFRCAADR